jgi:hypothetical protein
MPRPGSLAKNATPAVARTDGTASAIVTPVT